MSKDSRVNHNSETGLISLSSETHLSEWSLQHGLNVKIISHDDPVNGENNDLYNQETCFEWLMQEAGTDSS